MKINAERPDPPIRYTEQALVYYPGDGLPLVLNDENLADADDNVLTHLNDHQLRLLIERLARISRLIYQATKTREAEEQSDTLGRVITNERAALRTAGEDDS